MEVTAGVVRALQWWYEFDVKELEKAMEGEEGSMQWDQDRLYDLEMAKKEANRSEDDGSRWDDRGGDWS